MSNLDFINISLKRETFSKLINLCLILNDIFLARIHSLGLNCSAHKIRMVYKLYEGVLISA